MTGSLSSEILGFDTSARLLLVNADDFGMHPGVDRAIVDALDHGIVRSTSVMTVCPGRARSLESLSRRPETAVGVHLTLVRDRSGDDWRPNAHVEHVRSLVDDSGRLLPQSERVDLLNRARIEEVEAEFRAQIGAVRRAGVNITHLDFHSLADGGRPDVFDTAVALAAENGVALRVWLPPNVTRARAAGLPVVDHPFLDSFTIDPVGKAGHYERLLRGLPAGLTEWAVHPAVGDGSRSSADPRDRRVRTGDHRFLVSTSAQRIIEEEGIELVGYDAVRTVWLERQRGDRMF